MSKASQEGQDPGARISPSSRTIDRSGYAVGRVSIAGSWVVQHRRHRQPGAGAAGQPFIWKQDDTWKALEASFLEAREIGCKGLQSRTAQGFLQGRQYLAKLSAAPVNPEAPVLKRLEALTFGLGTRVAACPERLTDYVHLVTKTRGYLKRQSERWDLNDPAARDRLYRLMYGGRAALEEVMLQAPAGSVPALIKGDDVPSVTPSYAFQSGTLRSGDILVSRGGAPTSALIARGNDYPGNFSHVALLHVDEKTGAPGIVESHIEMGVVVSTVEQYIKDKKLRVMVLRLRPDLPQMKADPMLPHKAAKRAVEEVKSRHIPYDFEMNYREPSKWFCSEVASWAYREAGVELWKGTTRMSAPGVVRWLSYFGVTHFETQAPADLEYDPQLAVVAEWRDPETLWQDHVDNAVVEAMLEGADEGDAGPEVEGDRDRRNLPRVIHAQGSDGLADGRDGAERHEADLHMAAAEHFAQQRAGADTDIAR